MIENVSRWFRSYGYGEVFEHLSIGAYPQDDEDVSALEFIGVRRILNLVEDEEYEPGSRELLLAALDYAGIEEQRLSLTDFGHIGPEALEEGVRIVNGWLDEGLHTYVHCRAGWQRSAAIAAGVIAIREGVDIDQAVSLVRARRSSAEPLPHQREDLRRWWDQRVAGDAAHTERRR
jgi:protein-tyrosine phosphatase